MNNSVIYKSNLKVLKTGLQSRVIVILRQFKTLTPIRASSHKSWRLKSLEWIQNRISVLNQAHKMHLKYLST